MNQLKFALKQKVTLAASGESGEVIGRAEYTNDEPRYLVRYKAADGRCVENWWPESALVAAE
jgi:hypothetical protein